MAKFQFLSGEPGDEEDEIGLDQKGNRYQDSNKRIVNDIATLESEKQHQGKQETNAKNAIFFFSAAIWYINILAFLGLQLLVPSNSLF